MRDNNRTERAHGWNIIQNNEILLKAKFIRYDLSLCSSLKFYYWLLI